MKHKVIIEPFKIKSVEPIFMSTETQRKAFLEKANYNTFLLKSDQVIIDFLTDSGTSAMSAEQWAGVMRGDESYAGSKSWERMENAVKHLTGMEYVLPTHQGRAAERIIYGYLGGKGKHLSATLILTPQEQTSNFQVPKPLILLSTNQMIQLLFILLKEILIQLV